MNRPDNKPPVFNPWNRLERERPFSAWAVTTASRLAGAAVALGIIGLIWPTANVGGTFAVTVALSFYDLLGMLYPRWFAKSGVVWKQTLIGGAIGLVVAMAFLYIKRQCGL